jgi:antitoxin VapB
MLIMTAPTTSTTRIFKSGNSLAVRIPKDMTPAEIPDEASIEWKHGVWTIRPLHRRSLAGLLDRFKAFSPDFMAGGREFHDQNERDWSAGSAAAQPTARKASAKANSKIKAPRA